MNLIRLCAVALAGLAGVTGPAAAVSVEAAKIAPRVVNADAYPPRRVAFPGGVTGLPDLVYARPLGYRPLTLDLYLAPASFTGPRPLVVFVHGGGWVRGSPRNAGAFEDWPRVLASLAARGYVVASLSYRFALETPFPAAVQDVKASVRWLRANAGLYNIDPGRAVAWGASSGAQLAALAAVSCGVAALEPPPTGRPAAGPAPSDCFQAAVSWYGIFDFAMDLRYRTAALAPGASPRIENPYLGCGPCSAQALSAPSPATYLDPTDPPMLLLHGATDTVVPAAQSRAFHDAVLAAGGKAELVILPGVSHSLIGATQAATQAASLEALDRTFAFIDAVVGDPARP